MSITAETRREAYYESREDAMTRRKLLYRTLKRLGPSTVDELVAAMIRAGHIKAYDRNYIAPRLTELKEAGLVNAVGKRESKRTGKNITVWEAVEV